VTGCERGGELMLSYLGAAMRIGPMGAVFRDQPDLLARVVWEASLTTHGAMCAAATAYGILYPHHTPPHPLTRYITLSLTHVLVQLLHMQYLRSSMGKRIKK